MIEVKNLLKVFNKNKSNEVRAINDVSVEFPEKGLVAIYGASGSGKTTLMNALGGLDKFDGGEIIMNGNVYTKAVDDKYRIENIGYIFQNYLLDERLDVYQNVAQGLRTIGIKDEEVIFNRVMTALDNVGMRDYYKRSVTALSGGQQQRVAIARAMVKGAKIILADEPTGNLDEINTRTVMELLKALSTNCLVIVVTHEGDLIDKYADSVIEIKDGKIENLSEGGKVSHDTADKTRIFLGGKKKSNFSAQGVNIEYYGASAPVNLILVNENGKIYLKAGGENVRFVDDKSEIQLINSTEKEFFEQQRIKTYGAMNFLSNVQAGKAGRVFSLKKAFSEGLKSLFNKKKRFTLFTVSVFVFMIAIVIFMGVLGSHIYTYENVGTDFNKYLLRTQIHGAEEKKAIDEFVEKNGYDVEYEYVSNYSSRMSVQISGFEIFEPVNWSFMNYAFNDISETENMKWIYGSSEDVDTYDKIVISSGLADSVLSTWMRYVDVSGGGYYLLSNADVAMDYTRKVQIVGVVEEEERYVYISDLLWQDIIFGYRLDSYYGVEAEDNEVIVPLESSYEDTTSIFGKEFKVTKSDKVESATLNANEMRALVDRFDYYRELHIITSDVDKLADDLTESGLVSEVRTRKTMYGNEFDDAQASINRTLIIDAILISIMLIAAFFMFYASLASKAKEIGLYRAIGVSSGNILFKFFIESLALILVCVVSVYLVIGLPVLIFSDGSAMYFPLWLYFASMLGIIVCMSAVSVLPIISFIRKTPVEILSKYDV